jgi:hypothetical protein
MYPGRYVRYNVEKSGKEAERVSLFLARKLTINIARWRHSSVQYTNKGKNATKLPQNIPESHKIYQMSVK